MIDRHIDKIRTCILNSLGEENVSVALFGSSAAGTDTSASDVDIAVIPKGVWDRRKLSLLRDELENLNVPYIVDLVDFSSVSEKFKTLALSNAIWWKG
jgi:hypothetical protein